MEWFLLVMIGLFAGALGSIIGLGGGIIIVPALIYFSTSTTILGSMSPQLVVGTSLIIVIFTGLSSTLSYMKHKTVDYKTGFIFFAGSGPGSILGSWANQYLDLKSFTVYFGIFVILVSILLMMKSKLPSLPTGEKFVIKRSFTDNKGQNHEYSYNALIGILIAFAIGFCSSLFGIGGGSLIMPAMIMLFLFPPHVAVATSMFIIFLSAVISSIAYISLGHVHWLYTLALIPGAWFGAKLGVYINSKLQGNMVINLLRIILIIIGLRLIYQGITG